MNSDITELKVAEGKLRESEELFRRMFEEGPLGVAIIDMDFRFVHVNTRLCEMLGYTETALTELALPDVTYPDDIAKDVKYIERLFRGEIPFYHIEKRFVSKRQAIIWINLSASVIHDDDGHPAYGLAMIEDITKRKHASEQLGKLSRALAQTADLIIITDKEGVIEYVNPAFEELTGYTSGEALGKTPRILKSGAHPKEFYEQIWALIKSGQPFHGEITNRKKGGELYFEEKTITPIIDEVGNITHYVSTGKDLTERKRAEDELKASREQLRNLLVHMREDLEQERTRIAREVHDRLGQEITILKSELSWLKNKLSNGQGSLKERVGELGELADTMIQTVREIASELRPPLLDDLGLVAAVEWELSELQRLTGVQCVFHVEHDEIMLESDLSTALFRIFQEALANITRHAQATLVECALQLGPEVAEMRIDDNGIGITPAQVVDSKSYGLIGIRERAVQFGGEAQITRLGNGGTRVHVEVPLAESDLQND